MSSATHATTRGPRRDLSALKPYLLVGQFIVLIWAIEVVDVALGNDLDRLGIEPRDTDALGGILLAPLLHGGFDHLAGNTLPLAVLGVLVALDGARRLVLVAAIVTLAGGFGVWLIGPELTVHIGASGVVFGLATYLASKGLFDRRLASVAIGLGVLLLFGGTLLTGLIPEQGISWQGHLCGAIAGVVAARVLVASRAPRAARANR